MCGGWNNGPVRTPAEHIDCFVGFMRECFIVALILLAIGAVVDWLWIAE